VSRPVQRCGHLTRQLALELDHDGAGPPATGKLADQRNRLRAPGIEDAIRSHDIGAVTAVATVQHAAQAGVAEQGRLALVDEQRVLTPTDCPKQTHVESKQRRWHERSQDTQKGGDDTVAPLGLPRHPKEVPEWTELPRDFGEDAPLTM
jgi:hypothetical protein